MTSIPMPKSLIIGVHTVTGTGQFAHDGYDVASDKVITVLVLPVLTVPLAYQQPLRAAPAVDPPTPASSPAGGIAVVVGLGSIAVLMLGGGTVLLLNARRATNRKP
jgi:hypothetical protein